uniref:Uncharacterized protein n=1 Tax=Steinernema glaseri TaxID=37863 RepID=A0A1I7Y125_9BILA
MKVTVFCLLLVFFIVPVQSAKERCYWSDCYWAAFGGSSRNHCKEGFYNGINDTCPDYAFWHIKQYCCPING